MPPRPRGYKHSEETKNKIRNSHLGVKLSQKHIEGIRKAHLGIKQSEETKRKRSVSLKGRIITEEAKRKQSLKTKGRALPHLRGENSSRWNGGLTDISENIRRLVEYENWRNLVFRRDDYTCRDCGARGRKINAHHIKEFSVLLKDFLKLYSQFSVFDDRNTLLRLAMTYEPFWDISNGKTLCKKCHLLIPNSGRFLQPPQGVPVLPR